MALRNTKVNNNQVTCGFCAVPCNNDWCVTKRRTKVSTFQEKIQKKYPHFADEVQGLSVEQLENRLVKNAKYESETLNARDSDTELTEAKERAKFLAEPYRDTLKALKDQNKYIIELIGEKGGQV
jgi:hypothetical protein